MLFAKNHVCLQSQQGVCIGLSEVMASAGKHQLLNFMDELIPTIRTALCDRYNFLLIIVSLYLFHIYLDTNFEFMTACQRFANLQAWHLVLFIRCIFFCLC